jgi:hypothetical protein
MRLCAGLAQCTRDDIHALGNPKCRAIKIVSCNVASASETSRAEFEKMQGVGLVRVGRTEGLAQHVDKPASRFTVAGVGTQEANI